MRARELSLAVALIAAAGTAVHAQPSAPAAAADTPPAAEPAAAPSEQAPTAVPAAAPNAAPAAPAVDDDPAVRAARIARERAGMEAMLARARAEYQHRAQTEEREPAPVYGDAGAAFAFGISFDAPWYTDPGYDVYAENDAASRFGLWLGYDVASLSDDAVAALEIGWGTESEEGDALQVASTTLTTHVAYLGATVRWVPIDWLQPHLRLAGGAAIIDAQLVARDTFHDGAGGVFEDMISPYGSAGLGFTLRTATRTFEDRRGRLASLSFGLMFEGGYTLATPVDVKLEGPKPSTRNIPVAEPELGELERSGPYIRVSLVGRL
jgi:hypothetical protein